MTTEHVHTWEVEEEADDEHGKRRWLNCTDCGAFRKERWDIVAGWEESYTNLPDTPLSPEATLSALTVLTVAIAQTAGKEE